ncbi:hypothetical protein LINGRAHAP2_LOCUS11070 [Linum grandiflorum]
MITASIERWQSDTNTFRMPFREMKITLHDVLHILQIAIKKILFTSSSNSAVHLTSAARILDLTEDEVKRGFFMVARFRPLYLRLRYTCFVC